MTQIMEQLIKNRDYYKDCVEKYNSIHHGQRLRKIESAINLQSRIEAGEDVHVNYIGRCTRKGCKHVRHIAVPKTVTINGDIEAPAPGYFCTDHPHHWVSFKRVEGVYSEDHTCDARCINAKGHNCECSCGGENHGKAYAA